MIVTRAEMAAKARELVALRVPFRPYGRTLERMDCVGMIVWLGQHFGLIEDAVELPSYTFPPDPKMFDEWFPKWGVEKPTSAKAEGDVAIFYGASKRPQHTGVLVRSLTSPERWVVVGVTFSATRPWVGEYALSPDMERTIYKLYGWRGVSA